MVFTTASGGVLGARMLYHTISGEKNHNFAWAGRTLGGMGQAPLVMCFLGFNGSVMIIFLGTKIIIQHTPTQVTVYTLSPTTERRMFPRYPAPDASVDLQVKAEHRHCCSRIKALPTWRGCKTSHERCVCCIPHVFGKAR